ncbi:MAG: alpha/beta fold hydrolase [Microgenomates group bacterium]
MVRKIGIIFFLILFGGCLFYFWPRNIINPIGKQKEINNNFFLEKYDFDELRRVHKAMPAGRQVHKVESRKLEILGNIPEVEDRRTIEYDFTTREIRFKSDGKWVSGMINMPKDVGTRHGVFVPVIIMIRGYAEKEGYYVGSGSWKVADELARQSAGKPNYVTISLDFLGYGHSDTESSDMLEARFHKVVEVLDLIESVKQLPWVDKNRIGIWAHSNGGQIALSVLEITGQSYPTVLWAPMTQPFPESVLSTIDEGSPVKAVIEEFQKHYDSRRYAFENYYDWIKAPVLIQQGNRDNQVKLEWQRPVARAIGAELVVYEGADHNLKGGWNEAVAADLGFFGTHFK